MTVSDSLQLRVLLRQLCDLTDDDLELPFPILVNIHRGVLRAPLENLAMLAGGPRVERVGTTVDRPDFVAGAKAHVEDHYPALSGGDIYRDDRQVGRLSLALTESLNRMRGRHRLRQVGLGIPYATTVLVDSTVDTWYCYDPLVLLHRITWAREEQAAVAAVLNRELALNPQVREMILTLATARG